MPYNNSDKNTNKEFYTEVARLLGVTVPTVKRYWEDGFYEAIVRFIFLKGKCFLPHLGTYTTVYENEYFQEQTNENGEKVVYKVPARDKPVFTPHDTFENDINNMGVTKKYRKRVKKGQLSYMDYKRQERAALLGANFGSMSPERLQAQKENFKELLEKKKQEKEGES